MVTPHETHAPADSSAVLRPGSRFKMSGATVRDSIRDLPELQQKPIIWLFNHCKANDFGREQLSTLLKKPNGEFYSYDAVVALLSGGRIRRGETIEPMLRSITDIMVVEEARKAVGNKAFIETRMFRIMEARVIKARDRRRIGFAFGDSQIGKTENLREICRRNGFLYVEQPSGGQLGPFVRELARQLGIPAGNGIAQLKELILQAVTQYTTIIVDEAHRCLTAKVGASGSSTFDFIREIWNKHKNGWMLAFTYEGKKGLLSGKHAKAYEQIWRRRIMPLNLPALTPADDLALFAAQYGLSPAENEPISIEVITYDARGREKPLIHTDSPLRLQTEVNEKEGLGIWIEILSAAADMASEQGKTITWGAVLKAHAESLAEALILK